jgi:hypothetical protein
MCADIEVHPAAIQEPLFCLQCMQALILFPGQVMEVDDHTGVFLGYLHNNCAPEWKLKNPSCTVEPLASA